MSVQAVIKSYDGEIPALAINAGASGATPSLEEVLAVGASANDLAITDVLSLTGGTTGALAINSGAGEGLALAGAVGASLVATTGGCKVESTAGVLELNADALAGQLNIVLNANKLTPAPLNAAANGPTYTGAVRQLQIQVGGVDYYIALNPAAFA